MKNHILFLALFFISCLFSLNLYSQITRGALSGEIYISLEWYVDEYGLLHRGIFHSINNGKNITPRYDNVEAPQNSEMSVGKVIGDATSGTLYNYGDYELWTSFDYGESWEYMEDYTPYTSFFSGVNQGLIFKRNSQGLFKSTNYAASFELLPITVTCPITEIGLSEPEFYGLYQELYENYNLVHTIDYGQTYTEIPIDSTVIWGAPCGKFPRIARGTEPGELYLTSWWVDLDYKIFHSVDAGCTWTKKYESTTSAIDYWSVMTTAGREPGSFYVLRAKMSPMCDHTWICIDYSSDYGETFTTYFHDLDSTITDNATGLQADLTKNICVYPNPVHSNLYLEIESEPNHTIFYDVSIFDIYGKLVYENKNAFQGNHYQLDVSLLACGFYLIKIENDKTVYSERFIKK